MKKALKIAIISIILPLLTGGSVFATVLSENFLKEEIAKDIKSQLSRITKSEASVNILQMPYKTITVNGDKVAVSADISLDYFTTRTLAKVNIYVNGKNERTFGVPVEIDLQDYVWVAKELIRKNSALTNNNLQLEKRNIGSCLKFVTNKDFDFSGYLAQKSFSADEIIDKRFIELVPDVMRNNVVTVVFATDYLNMTIDAEAMENGKIGDYVTVKSQKYKKYYKGQIIGTNQVLVKI